MRIDNRVRQGGHNISDQDLERRAPRIMTNIPDATKRADLTAIYVSSVERRNFSLEGIFYNGEFQLTGEVPPTLHQLLSENFEVRQVKAISQRHPITAYFQP